MAQIAISPFVLKNVLLTIGTDSYEKHVSQVEFSPSASTQTWKGLGGNTHTAQGLADWTVTLTYAQDWETANSLSQYLLANEGTNVSVTFEPVSGDAGFTSTVTLSPGSVGGQQGTFATSSVTLGCTKPVLVPAVP